MFNNLFLLSLAMKSHLKYLKTRLTSSFAEESDFTVRAPQNNAHPLTNVIKVQKS